jgi:hypothetical protein
MKKTFLIVLSLSRIWALKFLKSTTTINTILFIRKFVHGNGKLYADSKTIEKTKKFSQQSYEQKVENC